jgi:hypothetical protein
LWRSWRHNRRCRFRGSRASHHWRNSELWWGNSASNSWGRSYFLWRRIVIIVFFFVIVIGHNHSRYYFRFGLLREEINFLRLVSFLCRLLPTRSFLYWLFISRLVCLLINGLLVCRLNRRLVNWLSWFFVDWSWSNVNRSWRSKDRRSWGNNWRSRLWRSNANR